MVYPDPREDSTSRSPNSGLQYSYGVDYRTLKRIYIRDPPRGLGILNPRAMVVGGCDLWKLKEGRLRVLVPRYLAKTLESGSPTCFRSLKDHINMRILHTMASGIPVVRGL